MNFQTAGPAPEGTPPDTLSTARLVLRKTIVEDAQVIFDTYANDPEVTRFLLWKPGQRLEELQTFLRRAVERWERGDLLTWAITIRESGALIGMIDVRVESSAQVGYVIARPYWNRGYMTEALRAVVDWTLSRGDIYRVWAVCDVENVASARVMEKAGMLREGVLRSYLVFPNLGTRPRDCFCYARVKSDTTYRGEVT
jgi:[ribosomal protein S5]-alanine N-acetyltransferase